MKHAIGPRKEIGIRTIFNILGPLSNPAGARHGVLGVYHRDLVPTLARAASALDVQHLFVVHGHDGLDEITTTTTSSIAVVRGSDVELIELDPTSLGLSRAQPSDLAGGDPTYNASLIRDILAGQKGAKRDITLLNAAAAIVAGGKARDLQEGLAVAAQSVDSGAAQQKLDHLIAATRS
jgi:anthranilate phosphoribosyltransferase